MKRLVLPVFAVVLVCGGVYFYGAETATWLAGYLRTDEEQAVPTMEVFRRDYRLQVPASGELVGLETVQVSTPPVRSGALKIAWMAEEGSIVGEDSLVVRFDQTDAQLTLEQSENTTVQYNYQIERSSESARGEMTVLEKDQQLAAREVAFAQGQIRKDEDIFSRWEIQESLMSAALAHYKKENLAGKVALRQDLTKSDLKILEIEKQRAEVEKGIAQDTLSNLSLTAPASGVLIYKRLGLDEVSVGASVWPGQPLAEIARMDQFRGIVQVLEKDISGITVGQLVYVTLSAFPGTELIGKLRQVARIAKQLDQNDPRKYFECEVLLDVPSEILERLKPGMKLKANIEVRTWEASVVLPKSAVIKDDSGWKVFVRTEADYAEKPVTIEASDHGFYIVSGLEEGNLVCLRHPFEDQKLTLPDFNAPAAAASQSRFVMIVN